MKYVYVALLTLAPLAAHATCASDASDKRLNGAAKTSFMQKCTQTAEQKCSTNAVGSNGKALSGAAKTSFVKKCVAEQVGS
jgi:hypothetical protein